MNPADRDRLARLRTKHRRQGLATLPGGATLPWRDALDQVADLRRHADGLALEAVGAARAAGVSWDGISAALGGKPTGEGLRQRYAGQLRGSPAR